MTTTLCAGMSETSLPARVIRSEARLYVGLVVDQLHARLALAVLRRSGEDGVLPEHRGRGLGQVDLVGVRMLPLDVDIDVRAHQRVAPPERRVWADVRQAEGVAQLVDGPLEEILRS